MQVILLRSGIACGSLSANKIPLKPKVLITLLIYQKYHSVRKYRISHEKVIILQYNYRRGDINGSVLRDKSKKIAKDIVFLCREIKLSHKESVLVNQLLRSATSIGANLHEVKVWLKEAIGLSKKFQLPLFFYIFYCP